MDRAASRPARALAVLALLAAFRPAIGRAGDGQDRFRIIDRVGPSEIEENIAVYIDQTLAGTFRLTPAHPIDSLAVSVPSAAAHVYALCGKVVTAGPDGARRLHEVDTSGTLTDTAGRTFEAMTSGFTLYFLADETPDRPPSAIRIRQGRACAPVTS